MKPPRPALRELARRLIEDEARHRQEPVSAAVIEEVFRRLRDRLVALIGPVGFAALLLRSLKLARTEAPALDRVEVTAGGGLGGLPEIFAGRPSGEASAAASGLLASFLELLASFIGADLTSRLAGKILREGGSEET